jgi:hypothetical protein
LRKGIGVAELINSFSWSISAHADFEECPKKRYWGKYVMWGGWKEDASEKQRLAYRLAKMENRFSIQGNAVERAVMWALHQYQSNATPDLETVYQTAARPYLNQCWQESRQKKWMQNPKKYCCLHEHYYPAHHHTPEKEMIQRIIENVKLCISNFLNFTLKRLSDVKRENELDVASADMGDPESFVWEGIKIYAIPDYVFRKDEEVCIYDWKTGARKEQHDNQLALYGLWAVEKRKYKPDKINVYLEYLTQGKSLSRKLNEHDLTEIKELIKNSVANMAEYLENGDIKKNKPLPEEDWEMSAEQKTCCLCNFFEICKPDFYI